MKVLFDTNVIFDIWGKSSDFEHSFTAFDIALFKGFSPLIASSMVPDFVYLLAARKIMSAADARRAFGALMEVVTIIDVAQSDCLQAFENSMNDLEDALLAYAAYRNGVDLIVTRNKRDFVGSPVAAITPAEFVEIYQPTCLDYEMIRL